MIQTRRSFVRNAAAGAALAALPRFASASEKRVEVRSNVNPTVYNGNIHITKAKGFFEAEGVKAEIPESFLDQSNLVQLLASGQLDVIQVSASPAAANAVLRGAPMKIISGGSMLPEKGDKPGSMLVVSDELYQKGVRTLADLKGQTIHIWPGLNASTGRGAILLLESAGLKKTDVTWQGWNNLTQLGQSFQAGTVQIAYLLEPVATVVRDRVKTHVLGRGNDVMRAATSLVIWANTNWMQSAGTGVVQFLKGMLRGVNYYGDSKNSGFVKNPDVVDILAKITKVDGDFIRRIGMPTFARDGQINVRDLIEDAEFLKSVETVKEIADFNSKSVIDLSFAKKAFDELKKEGKI